MSTTTSGLRIGGGSRRLAVWMLLAAAIVTVVLTSALVAGRPESAVVPPAGVAARLVPAWSGWSNASARLHQHINRKIAEINRQDSSTSVPVCEPCIERYQQ